MRNIVIRLVWDGSTLLTQLPINRGTMMRAPLVIIEQTVWQFSKKRRRASSLRGLLLLAGNLLHKDREMSTKARSVDLQPNRLGEPALLPIERIEIIDGERKCRGNMQQVGRARAQPWRRLLRQFPGANENFV